MPSAPRCGCCRYSAHLGYASAACQTAATCRIPAKRHMGLWGLWQHVGYLQPCGSHTQNNKWIGCNHGARVIIFEFAAVAIAVAELRLRFTTNFNYADIAREPTSMVSQPGTCALSRTSIATLISKGRHGQKKCVKMWLVNLCNNSVQYCHVLLNSVTVLLGFQGIVSL